MTTGVIRSGVVIDAQSNSVLTEAQADLLRASGVSAVVYTAFDHNLDLAGAGREISQLRKTLASMPDAYNVVESADGLRRAENAKPIGVILGLQSASLLADQSEHLTVLHDLGVRVLQLTYNDRNLIGSGWLVPDDTGVTAFGRSVIAAANRDGIAIDLSHCGLRTTLDAIDLSAGPVLVTHANPAAQCPSGRNKPDAVLRALAARGGVIGLTAFSPLAVRPNGGAPRLDDFLDLIDYTVDLIGIDHVGIGSDHVDGVFQREAFEREWGWQAPLYRQITPHIGPWYGYDTKAVIGFAAASDWDNLSAGLARRGYDEDAIDKIRGGNFVRVFQHVWQSRA
jgi:membrane dipeptidase